MVEALKLYLLVGIVATVLLGNDAPKSWNVRNTLAFLLFGFAMPIMAWPIYLIVAAGFVFPSARAAYRQIQKAAPLDELFKDLR